MSGDGEGAPKVDELSTLAQLAFEEADTNNDKLLSLEEASVSSSIQQLQIYFTEDQKAALLNSLQSKDMSFSDLEAVLESTGFEGGPPGDAPQEEECASLQDVVAENDSSATCTILACDSDRGKTKCINGKCECEEGYCAVWGKLPGMVWGSIEGGVCVERAAAPARL